jgi:5'-nucleotidase
MNRVGARAAFVRSAALCAVLFLAASCSSMGGAGASAPRGALNILLTNDDGYQSPGIHAVRQALESAGHNVTLVAPLENRSGSGSSTTTAGELELREQGPRTWSVGGTPADAVRVGLEVVLGGVAPDLVISGANFGQNVGPSTLTSGTVGAALTAMQAGIPAIAISVEIKPREVRTEPRFKSTIAAFPDASKLVARIVAELDASRADDGALLPMYTALNVNYPAVPSSELGGVVWAEIGRGHDFHFGYERRKGQDNLDVVFRAAERSEPVANADTTLIADGYATITVVDGDIRATDEATERMQERLFEVAP